MTKKASKIQLIENRVYANVYTGLSDLYATQLNMDRRVVYKTLLNKIRALKYDSITENYERCNVHIDDLIILLTDKHTEATLSLEDKNILLREAYSVKNTEQINKWNFFIENLLIK